MRTTNSALPRGIRLSPLAAGLALAFAPAFAATITVTSNGDSVNPDDSVTTLREAILAANANCGIDSAPSIAFSGPFTISPSLPLPAFFCAAGPYNPSIDGGGSGFFTPPSTIGYDANVVLNGTNAPANCGLEYQMNFSYGGNLTVRGMKIQNFTYGSFSAGLCGIVNAANNLFSGNSIGARPEGNSTMNSIGVGLSNVFVGNTYGIYLENGIQQIIGNRFGTLNGFTASPNGVGIYVNGNSFATIRLNYLSGNDTGIYVYSDYGGSTIEFNSIGMKLDSSGALPNGTGIEVRYSDGPSIRGNSIAGNSGAGISINDSSITLSGNEVGVIGSTVIPNAVGLEAFCSGYIQLDDNDFRGNTGDGVSLSGVNTAALFDNVLSGNGGSGLRLSASVCSYGGVLIASGNTITDNGGDGVTLAAPNYWAVIEAGSITGNALKNLNSPNDVAPVITSVIQNADASTTIFFTMTGVVDETYHIQFYANSVMGKPGGETYRGDTFITIASNPQEGSFTLGGALDAAKGVNAATLLPDNISATASTDCCSGYTSEFSQMKAASTAPQVVTTPTVLDFGSVEVDTSSAAKMSQLRSMGDQPISFFSIADAGCYGGPICYGGAFICSTTCETSTPYANGQACTITARFAPTFTGFQTSSIYLCHNGLNNPAVVTLQGDAIPPPPLVLSPTEWDFGDVAVATTSEPKVFNLTSRYEGNLPIALGTTGEFDIVSNDCGSAVPAMSTCHIGVAFGPTESGGRTGSLTVTVPLSDAATVSQGPSLGGPVARAILRGNAVLGGQLVLPERVDLGAAIVGGEPISRTAQIVNEGTNPVTLNLLQVSEPFSLTHDCPPVLEPGMACTLTLVFTPPVAGPFTGTLTVMSSDRSAEIPISAMGQTAATALIKLTPVSIGFGSRMIGSASPTQAVTISNIGGADATNFSLASSAIDFFIAGNNCGATLAAGTSCVASVGFRPLGFGTRLGSLLVTSTAVNSPAGANLSGTGCRPFAAASSRFGSSASCAP